VWRGEGTAQPCSPTVQHPAWPRQPPALNSLSPVDLPPALFPYPYHPLSLTHSMAHADALTAPPPGHHPLTTYHHLSTRPLPRHHLSRTRAPSRIRPRSARPWPWARYAYCAARSHRATGWSACWAAPRWAAASSRRLKRCHTRHTWRRRWRRGSTPNRWCDGHHQLEGKDPSAQCRAAATARSQSSQEW
jgi:hypothetical protein